MMPNILKTWLHHFASQFRLGGEMNFKKNRIINISLLKTYHFKPCEVCSSLKSIVAHHVKNKGSGGHDIPINLMALCQKHHHEIHQGGRDKFLKKYPMVQQWLNLNGWEIDILIGWYHPDA